MAGPVKRQLPRRPRAVEIKPMEGKKRGVALVHDEGLGIGLHMYWAVDGPVNPSEHHPNHGLVLRTVAYLTVEERRAMAAELLDGLT